MPRCRKCREKFVARVFMQKYCEKDACISAFLESLKEERQKKQRAEAKKRKEALLTHKDWLNILQKVFNTFIRLRDKDEPCISCGTTSKTIKYDAGHYFTVGGYPNVRFDEDNVHKQCSNNCNMKLSGNIIEYRPRLIKKIGEERFEALEFRARNESGKLSIPEIKEKIAYYKQRIKELKINQ